MTSLFQDLLFLELRLDLRLVFLFCLFVAMETEPSVALFSSTEISSSDISTLHVGTLAGS
jgi:hypothetical protein